MKQWQVTFIGAVVMFAAGLIMLFYANTLEISSFIGSDYYLVSNDYMMAFLAGTLFIGFGGGLLVSSLLIFLIENRMKTKSVEKAPEPQEDMPTV